MNASVSHKRRVASNLAALGIGLPMAAGVLAGVTLGPWRETSVGALLSRYLTHPVEMAIVVLFCAAVGVLLAKLRQLGAERAVLRGGILPSWDGRAVPVDQAAQLTSALHALPASLRNTFLAQRVGQVLDFLVQRRSSNELDDQLRELADTDALELESSYSLVRFITWAMPMLGFIGTVLGITGAIAGVTPEVLEQSLSTVTDGLALAFDSTALALCLTMALMFLSYLVERQEQAIVGEVDRTVEKQLAHRFQRTGVDNGPFVGVIQQATQAMLEAMGQLVQRQAELWSQSLAIVDRRAGESQAKLAGAIEEALERTLAAHAQRLAGVEKHSTEQLAALALAVRDTAREQQMALTQTAEAVSRQAAMLGQLVEGEKQLVQAQSLLHQNLAALAGAGAFEQAVHSLSAAVHLLTAKANRPMVESLSESEARSVAYRLPAGKAA